MTGIDPRLAPERFVAEIVPRLRVMIAAFPHFLAEGTDTASFWEAYGVVMEYALRHGASEFSPEAITEPEDWCWLEMIAVPWDMPPLPGAMQ